MHKNDLHGRRPRKKPLHKTGHLKDRINFAKRNIDKSFDYWSKILWSDETKLELFGHSSAQYVWRKNNESFDPKNTIPTVKHGGGSLMFCCKWAWTIDLYQRNHDSCSLQ